MKTTKILKWLPMLAVMLAMCLAAVGCTDGDDGNNYVPPAGDCFDISFIDAYSMYSESKETYFVKGVALDVVHEYGRNIKLIEDFKGNFPKDISIFTLWGVSNDYNSVLNRWDDLSIYENKDTLVLFLCPAKDLRYMFDDNFYEKIGDYATLSCVHSVFKFSDDYVSGQNILSKYSGEETILLKELLKTLKGD